MAYKTLDPQDVKTAEVHALLLGAIAPRPIAFASTTDLEGNVNLSPFSFFNVFSAKPPILVFSPARRVRDNTSKHTLENVWYVSNVSFILDLKILLLTIKNMFLADQTAINGVEPVQKFKGNPEV